MAQISEVKSNHGVVCLDIKDSDLNLNSPSSVPNNNEHSGFYFTAPFIQKVIAELGGTYLLIFGGCAVVVVNLGRDNVVTFPGIAIAWGLLVMVLVYSISHISGAHFNPAITIAFASCNRFPWKQTPVFGSNLEAQGAGLSYPPSGPGLVPAYIAAQVVGSTLASGTLRLIFNGKYDHFAGTAPAPGGSDVQSLILEFIITFFLMFVVCSIATDDRAIKELAGLVIGATVSVNVFFAGPITGASMNPARSLGPAIVWNQYKGLWIYIVGPTFGAVGAALVYNIFRPKTDESLPSITKTWSCCHRGSGRISSTGEHRQNRLSPNDLQQKEEFPTVARPLGNTLTIKSVLNISQR
ncbi:hypothetical protein HYC85_017517 [Camellia sinensis]|uniref:Uncharacterized protein n=1 Tax=Camellia sinensis TaxID=4442 RepID=A0A7J7GRW5_CAMSI|nr:hypothetical protein HYC85_017517 [Camellia sinensis]